MNSRKLRVLALLLSAIMTITAVPSTLFAEDFVGEPDGWDSEIVTDVQETVADTAVSDDFDLGFSADIIEFDDSVVGEVNPALEQVGDNTHDVTFYYHEGNIANGHVTYTMAADNYSQLRFGDLNTECDPLNLRSYAAVTVAAKPDNYATADYRKKLAENDAFLDGQTAVALYYSKDALTGTEVYDCTKIIFFAKINGKIWESKPFDRYVYNANGVAVKATHNYPAANITTTSIAVATCKEPGKLMTTKECSICGSKEVTYTDLDLTDHNFVINHYELGENAKFTGDDNTVVPVPVDGTKSYKYTIVYTCSYGCGTTDKEEVEVPITDSLITYANPVNIYKPEEQLVNNYLRSNKIDNTLLSNLRLVDCAKDGSYEIITKNPQGVVINKETITVPAHHSPIGSNKYVDANKKEISAGLFVIDKGVVYSRTCQPLEYYLACPWCGNFVDVVDNPANIYVAKVTTTTPTVKTANPKDPDAHNFTVSASAINAATTFDELKVALPSTFKDVTPYTDLTKPQVTVNENILNAKNCGYYELAVPENCDDGGTVDLTYYCVYCGTLSNEITSNKYGTSEKMLKEKFNLPVQKKVAVAHSLMYKRLNTTGTYENPSCTEAGYWTSELTCRNPECKYKDTIKIVDPATGHDLDKSVIVTKITGDVVLDSIRDRMYKKGQTHNDSIGFIEDKSVSVVTGYKCRNCAYVEPVAKTNTLEIMSLNAKSIDEINPIWIQGQIKLKVIPQDENGKIIGSTLVGADGKAIDSDGDYGYNSIDDANLDYDEQFIKTVDNTTNQFTAKFGLVSIDYQPAPTEPTEAPVESSTKVETPSETSTKVETPSEATSEETPSESTTKETPAESTTKEAPAEPTTAEPATMPGQVLGAKVYKNSPTKKVIGVKYQAVDNADYYSVNVRKAGETAWTKNLTDGAVTAYEITGLTEGEAYDIRIAAVANGIAGPRSAHLYRWLKKVTIEKPKKVKGEAGAVTVSWDDANATKYMVYYSQDKAFKTGVKKGVVTGTSAKITGLSAGKYYFKVRCFKTIDGITYTGAWSNVKSKKIQ